MDICCGNTEHYTTYTSTPDTAAVMDQDQGNAGVGLGRGHGQCSADISGEGDGYL